MQMGTDCVFVRKLILRESIKISETIYAFVDGHYTET